MIIFIVNILDQANFFKNLDVHFSYPIYLSFLNTPSIVFEILPFIFLISTQFFFIKLIDSQELEIFKYSGLTNFNIIKIISLFAFFLGILLIIFFYNISSLMKSNYLDYKNKYTNDNKYLAVITENGLWRILSKPETWPVQNENTSIQYPVWFSNTEVSVSVFNLKNTE